jgi:rRNA-processing protein FCF1
MDKPEFIAKLESSPKVDFLTYLRDHSVVLVMTRDAKLVESLKSRGAKVRWYDRTEFSTKAGRSKADMQCEVLMRDDRFLYEVAA